jgi:acyl dehydratase
MSDAEYNQKVDKWYQEMVAKQGKKYYPKVGSWAPVNYDIGLHAEICNEYMTTDLIRHFCEATGDRNPLFTNEEYAKKSVWGGIVAPPTITDAIAVSWPTARGKLADLDFELAGLPAGSKRQWFAPIRPGERYHLVDEFVGLTEKKRPAGAPRLFVEERKRNYINQNNVTTAVVYCHMVHQATPKGPLAEFKAGNRPKHKFTDAERDAIYKGYDTETRRGANTLKWDEVSLGENVKPLLVGPVSTWDTAAWLAALAGYCMAFDLQWDISKADFAFAFFDKENNFWKCGGEGHLADGLGHSIAFSGGRAFTYGSQIEALIVRSINNWMGDGGFLKELDCQFRNIPLLHDVYNINATVTNKQKVGQEKLVDLKVQGQNQDGLPIVIGTAQIRLP